MELQEYARKRFVVNAVQVTLDNIHEVAEWCKGTVQLVSTRMLGVSTDLPVIKLQGQGDLRGKQFTASLGCFVAELRGSFRVYKPSQMEANFELVSDLDEDRTVVEDEPHELILPDAEDMKAAI